MTKYLLIAAGGATGSVLRYALQTYVQRLAGPGFPWGTLAVNAVGCFVAGFLAAAFMSAFPLRDEFRLALGAGLLGGFTTFSAFGLETFQLAMSGQMRLALVNVLASVALGMVAVWAGYRGSQWLLD
jgi:fluoride exporter